VDVRSAEVVVFLARRRRTEVLVLRRTLKLGGYWHPIAGGVEADETHHSAAAREVMEETGLQVEGLDACPRTNFRYAVAPPDAVDHRGVRRSREVAVDCVLVEVSDDYEPTLNWEHDVHRWCSVEEAARLLHWRNVADALRELLPGVQASAGEID
jgi:8-oxo-dGTP pyrophosphatase MutT (NUDIX family)